MERPNPHDSAQINGCRPARTRKNEPSAIELKTASNSFLYKHLEGWREIRKIENRGT